MKSVIGFSYNKLSVCVLTVMLVACGGGGGASSEANQSAGNKPSNPVRENYSEPEKDVLDSSTLGYYDYNSQGSTREIRNDLEGSFQAMLQFGQQHVVDPNGNEAKKMPRLTTEKEALLLVTPTLEMGDIQALSADIYMGDHLLRTIVLDDPSLLPVSDQTNTDERARVSYSKRAWSARLNWDEIRPGLNIRITDSAGRQGQIAESQIDFAAPGELLLNNIRIGMLTDPPNSTDHYMLLEPVKAGTDYFQTIPAAKMVVAKYDDMKLSRVMVSNATIYDVASTSTGGDYIGDMREDVGKSTFSVGINLANWGVTSASMASQNQPQLTQTVVAHHTKGNYANGVQSHGLSGGNGMLTLYASVGNEFSHEIGHHYGLGHYPGNIVIDKEKNINDEFWTSHHADSGWGYIPYRNMMRGNLIWNSKTLWGASTKIANFLNLYPHSRDSMSGGFPSSSVSRYTHYTGYSTFLSIQPHFNRYVWDEKSPTGYKKWNTATRQMEVTQPLVPTAKDAISKVVWFNSADGNYLKPRLFGVPVFTILGGYDPDQQVGLLYPAARTNWGNVYDLPAANTAASAAACWLNVHYPSQNKIIALSPNRMGSNANKLHVNLAISDQPKSVDLYCKKANEVERLLSSMNIPQYETAIAPAVYIGKEQGYSALRALELPTLENELTSQAENSIIVLKPATLTLYHAYKQFKHEMNASAQQQMTRYEEQQNTLMRLNRWVNVYRDDLTKGLTAATDALNAFVTRLSLQNENILEYTTLLKNNNNCLKTELTANNKMDVYISAAAGCKSDETEQWIFDSLGRIHNKAAMGQCLTGNGGSAKVTLTDCVMNNQAQVWEMNTSISAITQSNQCLDLNTGNLVNGRQIAIRYNCTGGGNQKWTMLNQNPSLILAGATSKNIDILIKNLKATPVQ